MRTQSRRSWESYVFGGQFEPSNPFIASNDGGGDGGGGGGGGNTPPKTFTQDQLNAFLAEERRKTEQSIRTKLEGEFKSKADEATAALNKRIEELELQGKSAEEQARIKAQNDAKAAAKQIEEREANYKKTIAEQTSRGDSAEQKLRARIEREALATGLSASNVLGTALKDALAQFHASTKVELDSDENVVSVTYGGVAHKTANEAAAAFLKDRPYYQAASGGGSGARSGIGGSHNNNRSLDDMSEDELLAADAAQQQRR